MKAHNINKLLVLRLSSLGDVILTTPFLKYIKQKHPEAIIDYCTKSAYIPAIEDNPNINSIITLSDLPDFKELRMLKKSIKSSNYDLIIDAHNNFRTFYLKIFSGIKTLTFRKYSIRKFLLVKLKINLMKNLPPITVRYINILGKFYTEPVNDNLLLPEIITQDKNRLSAETLFENENIPGGRINICITASTNHFTKTYPAEYFAEVINKFDTGKFNFLLTGKNGDIAEIEKIKSITGNNVYNLCDCLGIKELTEVMKKCQLVISGDTGPMHIAEALNIPLIMIAGSSVKEFGFYPQNQLSAVLENTGLKCRPCSHIGRSSCPEGHFKCMTEIKPSEIYNTAVNLLDNRFK